MVKTVIVLPDGRQLSSGIPGQTAIAACTVTESVTTGTELCFGGVCAAMAEIKLLLPEEQLPIAAGDELTVFQNDRQLGIFIAEKPERTGRHTATVTAYDRVTALDIDMTDALTQLDSWPYSLQELAQMVCDLCGVQLANGPLLNADYPVEKFSASGITGRKLMQWICEAAGCFCRAREDGQLEFAWYAPAGTAIAPRQLTTRWDYAEEVLSCTDPDITVTGQQGTVAITAPHWLVTADGLWAQGSCYYFSGSLSYADYSVLPVGKLQICQNEQDVGALWPADVGAANTYRITANPLLAGSDASRLQQVAKKLYGQLQNVTYTPCRVTVPADAPFRPGQIVKICDLQGKAMTMYIMTCKRAGQQLVLECTGSQSRQSVTAMNAQTYEAVAGKVLQLRTDIEGIKAENKAADGRVAALTLNVDGISAQVEKQTTESQLLRRDLSYIQQMTDAVHIGVQTIREQGVSKVQTGMGYTFDDEGLKIARTGQQIENLLDNTGMYVTRSGDVILQANADGVAASDVAVHNYLIVGSSRLESYETGRTACFYIGP